MRKQALGNKDEIIKRFIDKGFISGLFIGNVPVGVEYIRRKYFQDQDIQRVFDSPILQKIDWICAENRRGDSFKLNKPSEWLEVREQIKNSWIWILEIVRKLDMASIGRAITYKYHFAIDNYPYLFIRKIGIVCQETDELIENICWEKQLSLIRIFRV